MLALINFTLPGLKWKEEDTESYDCSCKTGIFYDEPSVLEDLQQWINVHKFKENRYIKKIPWKK